MYRTVRCHLLKSAASVFATLCGGRVVSGKEKNIMDSKHLPKGVLTDDEVRSVSPALENYTKGALLNDLWTRPELSRRDRSLVTIAALIARIQTIEMPFHFALALDNGVKAAELSEAITHLAFYSGWANAMAAVSIAKDVFRERCVKQDQLPPAKEHLLALNEEAEEKRATQVGRRIYSFVIYGFGRPSRRVIEAL